MLRIDLTAGAIPRRLRENPYPHPHNSQSFGRPIMAANTTAARRKVDARRHTDEPVESAPADSGLRKMLTGSDVARLTGFSKATIYRLERAGNFPPGTFISSRHKVWFLDQLVRWQREVEGRRFPRLHRGGKPRRVRTADVEA
jgi:predicted DNA-binding transcriptional regulator AlpA